VPLEAAAGSPFALRVLRMLRALRAQADEIDAGAGAGEIGPARMRFARTCRSDE
jgi:hypothetical protein